MSRPATKSDIDNLPGHWYIFWIVLFLGNCGPGYRPQLNDIEAKVDACLVAQGIDPDSVIDD